MAHHRLTHQQLGKGHQVKQQVTQYIAKLKGQGPKYQEGVLNLSYYRRQHYQLQDWLVSFNMEAHERPRYGGHTPSQYADGVLNLNLGRDDDLPEPLTEEETQEHILGVIIANQYTQRKILELFGEKAEEANVKESKHIHDMDTYTPISVKTLTREE